MEQTIDWEFFLQYKLRSFCLRGDLEISKAHPLLIYVNDFNYVIILKNALFFKKKGAGAYV